MDFNNVVLLALFLWCSHSTLVDNVNTTIEDDLIKLDSETSEPDIFSRILKANKELFDTSRNAMICDINPKSCLWPSSKDGNVYIPYKVDESFRNEHRKLIKRSLDEIATFTCIKFYKYRGHERAYVSVVSGIGCSANIGYLGLAQRLSLNPATCMHFGVIEHEFLHAIGFHHEHCRNDRDNYIKIILENVLKKHHYNFNKKNTNNLGTEYDYGSIMHYGRKAFSKNGNITIQPLRENIEIGQIRGLSTKDVYKINKLYNCDECGSILVNKTGDFTSPNFPGFYPNNAKCKWMIRTAGTCKILLEFLIFKVHESGTCHGDYLAIYDGINNSAHKLDGPTCGTENPAVISSRNELFITFFSNWKLRAPGFAARYRLIRCGHMLKAKQGKFQSKSEYSFQVHCFWVLMTERKYKIVLQFEKMDLEENPNCTASGVIIHDAASTPPVIAGRYCGKMKLPFEWTSFGRTVVVEFQHSQSEYNYEFKMKYHSIRSEHPPTVSKSSCDRSLLSGFTFMSCITLIFLR
ncbi:astacin-like metalloendopeptidase isoform X2 [Narcine bancroftii]|uniref:astacin-like metalloendopeptidase isoform X2 n=1 Tax=Narcine bancroftii TaxID=1343680 RepID=UPI0038315DF1